MSDARLLIVFIGNYEGIRESAALVDFETRMEAGFRAREAEWLRRIKKITKTPVLVVCGSAHVNHFSELLIENDFEVIIENPLWE
ncbi:hypothetical protein [Motilimonas pumila]|uniref:TraB family protein n=1 Tax=Motilimonas pumila TaxID=2303987 RepID=A0A418Y935_9GAMM|nr:hypothetical protein [Motilimonas pumila]RJG36119.1 hypothetical protein D1Z90_20540 [Motilimonas pumila]